MDLLIPFLPRINYVTPIDKSTLYVVGVSNDKLRKIHRERKKVVLSELASDVAKEEKNTTNDSDEKHIDTWA